MTALFMIAFYYIYIQFRSQLENEFYESLRSKAFLTGEMLVGKIKSKEDTKHLTKPNNEHNPLSTENITIYDDNNTLLYSFSQANINVHREKLDQVRSNKEKRFVNDKYNSIGVLFKNKYGIEYVIVAESVFNYTQLNYLISILVWVYLLSLLLTTLAGWFFSGQALRPVNIIMNEVNGILPSDMTHRLHQSDQKDELSRLVQTFNSLLDRMQSVFENQKIFLSNISHELKNPLNVITSQIDISLNKNRTAEEYKSTLQSVYEDIVELNDVSSKLMQLSKINSDGSSIKFDKIRIDEILYQVKYNLEKSNPNNLLQIQIGNLPEKEDLIYYNGNEQLIKTAFHNILENSIKYGNGKQITVAIDFKNGKGAEITVKDNGIGIEENDLKNIFEPFFRAKNTSQIKGSGIGLSLVRSIFDLHGFILNVKSEKNIGSTFIITIPEKVIKK